MPFFKNMDKFKKLLNTKKIEILWGSLVSCVPFLKKKSAILFFTKLLEYALDLRSAI